MTDCTTKSGGLMLAEVLALLAVAAGTLWAFPLLQAMQMTTALTVAYLVARSYYARCCHACMGGRVVLLLAALWLAAIAVPFVHHATLGSGATFRMPTLYNDAARYYDWALAHYDGSAIEPTVTFWGYPLMIVGLWRVLGVSIIWPVALNVMMTLLTIVLTGQLAARVVATDQRRTATVAMAMIAVQAFFMSQGAQMLKESWVYLAITLIAYSLVPLSRSEKQEARSKRQEARSKRQSRHYSLFIFHYSLFFVGCFVLAAVRAKYVNFIFIAIVMLAVAGRLRQWRYYATLLMLTAVCWWMGMAMTDNYTIVQQVNNVTGQGGMDAMFPAQGAYHSLLGDYYHYPLWKKLLYLPITCGVQWVIPFPWLPAGSHASWLGMVPRLRLGWYVLSGVVVYFYIFVSWRRNLQWMAWAWFPMVCYVGIAYMTSGTVSRYILAFEPWWMVLAAVTVLTCWRQRSLRIFMGVYLLLVVTVLAICHQV